MNSKIVMATSRQTQDNLLCGGKDGCEEILNHDGENWTLPVLMKKDRTFPLYDILRAASPIFDEDDAQAYAVSSIPAIDVAKLTHFAMGIFWKASVHSWKKGRGEPRIQLGRYSDAIRKYLLGEVGFPNDLALVVHVGVPEKAMVLFSEPMTGKNKHSHFFYVPGIMFTLMVGERLITEEIKAGCFATSVQHPILVMEGVKALFAESAKHQYFKARKARNVIDAQKRHNEALAAKGPRS